MTLGSLSWPARTSASVIVPRKEQDIPFRVIGCTRTVTDRSSIGRTRTLHFDVGVFPTFL